MQLHPYPFVWRLRRFNALLIMILRHMGKARELDVKISDAGDKIGELQKKLEQQRIKLGEIKKGTRGKYVKKQITRINREIRRVTKNMSGQIKVFCKNARAELKDFKSNEIDDYTLMYRASRHLRKLADVLLVSKKLDNNAVGRLKRELETEMSSVERKAGSLELQAKYLERGVANTVVFSQMSPLGNRWVEGRIRRKAIEIKQIHDILNSNEEETYPAYFEKMVLDIYNIARDTNMLMKRLRSTFNSLRKKMREMGISHPEITKTRRLFQATFRRMEKIGRRLDIEMKDQANELRRDISKVDKEPEIVKAAA